MKFKRLRALFVKGALVASVGLLGMGSASAWAGDAHGTISQGSFYWHDVGDVMDVYDGRPDGYWVRARIFGSGFSFTCYNTRGYATMSRCDWNGAVPENRAATVWLEYGNGGTVRGGSAFYSIVT